MVRLSKLAGLLVLGLGPGIAQAGPCDRCIDRFEGTVEARGHQSHSTMVDAGRDYRVTLSPRDANADLMVAADGDWPPAPVACRSAVGGTAADSCEFHSDTAGPMHLFVVGGAHDTGYELRVEPLE